jgi:hypothetical protein
MKPTPFRPADPVGVCIGMNPATTRCGSEIDAGVEDRVCAHTLGPTGTNCEAAVWHWARLRGLHVSSALHPTFEDALAAVKDAQCQAVLLGCIAYPDLHKLVYHNLDWLTLVDQFIMDTFNIVLAKRPEVDHPLTAVSHPAPRPLAESRGLQVTETTSNSQAARLCAQARFDACLTTSPAAAAAGLVTIEDFGPIPMGFTIHRAGRTA